MCLDKFNPTILCGNIPNLLFILGLELPGYFLCSPIMYMSSYAIQKNSWCRNTFLFICSNQWNSDVWGEISSLKSRLMEANTNPCSEIRDLICYRLIYRKENTVIYPELVRHIMNLCLLLLMDVLKTVCLASGSCTLAQEVVREGIYLLRSRWIPGTSEQLGQIFGKSQIEEEHPGQPLWAEHGVGTGSQGHCSHWPCGCGDICVPLMITVVLCNTSGFLSPTPPVPV